MPLHSNPHVRLRAEIEELIGRPLPHELPKRWEKFSDVAILPEMAFTESGWDLTPKFWEKVAESLGVARLARMGEVVGEKRESTVELLFGDDDWVVRREHGIDFGYHFTRCMWSSGNITERGRIANMNNSGEKILDLYAGIGYYTLPFLSGGVRGPNGETSLGSGAYHVVSCEWNPEAVSALEWSLEKNGLSSRCTILEGDNRVTLNEDYFGKFDRVNLGLLPSSEGGYELALKALKPEGGILHVHGLAPGKKEEKWAEELAKNLTLRGEFNCIIFHIEKVKWYAPHQRHIVVDIHAAPVSN